MRMADVQAQYLRTRAFIERMIGGSVALGVVMRLRILRETPFPQQRPLLWLFVGLVEGLAPTLLLAAVGLLLARGVTGNTMVRKLLGGYILLRATLFFVWSEVIIYFGHPPRRLDLDVGLRPSFYIESVRGRLGAEALLILVFVVIFVVWASRSARRATRAWITIPKLIALELASASIFLTPLPSFNESARGPIVGLVELLRKRERFGRASRLRDAEPLAAAAGLRVLASPEPSARAMDPRYPFAFDPLYTRPSLPTGSRPNIVFLMLEGLRSEEVGAFGGAPARLTPNLDRLASRGIRFERAYSPGTHTSEGELAYWYGLLPTPGRSFMPNHAATPVTGLPEILRSLGWRNFAWMYGGNLTFFERDTFYGVRGFRYFDGSDFAPSDPRTSWGFSDRSLARRAPAILNALREPFAAMVVTISNHHPFSLPSDDRSPFDFREIDPICYGHYTRRMLATVHYTDEAVGDFFARIVHEPWYSRTIFVIGGDHGLPVEPVGISAPTPFLVEELQHRIPLMLFSPLFPGQRTISGPTSEVDIMPTLLGLVAPGHPRAGVGADVLGPPPSQHPIALWSDRTRTVSIVFSTRTYRAVVSENSLTTGRAEIVGERWVDPSTDPRGERDLSTLEPREVAHARVLAVRYFNEYPILVESGHSGLPPAAN